MTAFMSVTVPNSEKSALRLSSDTSTGKLRTTNLMPSRSGGLAASLRLLASRSRSARVFDRDTLKQYTGVRFPASSSPSPLPSCFSSPAPSFSFSFSFAFCLSFSFSFSSSFSAASPSAAPSSACASFFLLSSSSIAARSSSVRKSLPCKASMALAAASASLKLTNPYLRSDLESFSTKLKTTSPNSRKISTTFSSSHVGGMLRMCTLTSPPWLSSCLSRLMNGPTYTCRPPIVWPFTRSMACFAASSLSYCTKP
mmetsp:Transcript_43714/g.123527  ORF Transcript_43714/g.123527 Transcript_43714/m.123527 type:complete len:255 (-) Transcript_43714:511-1275(-)